MSGIHTLYRKSNGTNFTGVESKIILPAKCGYRDNNPTSSGKNGSFPEFFHGFYKGSSYGLDIGIIYKGGVYRLFFYSYANTQSTQWFTSSKSFTVGSTLASRTFSLKSYSQDGYLITRCYNSSGIEVAALDVYLSDTAYASMVKGCTLNREMCLAINKDATGKINVPADCYFEQAKWTETKMTTVNGTVVAMTNSNTTTQHGKVDSGTPTTSYDKRVLTGVMEGSYVADVGTATFNKTAYPVKEIV